MGVRAARNVRRVPCGWMVAAMAVSSARSAAHPRADGPGCSQSAANHLCNRVLLGPLQRPFVVATASRYTDSRLGPAAGCLSVRTAHMVAIQTGPKSKSECTHKDFIL